MKYLWDTDTCIYWFKGIEKILVTNNLAHYERIEGLKIENWLKARNL
ncbi:MAG: hypothetical protein AB1595_04550 [bacterium]